jgi:hypothetical protein
MESQKNRSPIPHRKRGAITIEDAIAAFMASRSNRGIAAPTLNKYRTFVKQLRAYCDSRGYVLLDQLGVADMDRFYASWNDGNRSRAKKLERLKSFIKFCLKRKWLAEDIADDLRAPEGSSIPANKMPFTDEEFDRINAACDTLGGPKSPAPVSPLGRRRRQGFRDGCRSIPVFGLRMSRLSILANGSMATTCFFGCTKPRRSCSPGFTTGLLQDACAREKARAGDIPRRANPYHEGRIGTLAGQCRKRV